MAHWAEETHVPSRRAFSTAVDRAQALGSEGQIQYHYAVWSRASYIASLGHSFPTCKMGIITATSHRMAVKIQCHNKDIRYRAQ